MGLAVLNTTEMAVRQDGPQDQKVTFTLFSPPTAGRFKRFLKGARAAYELGPILDSATLYRQTIAPESTDIVVNVPRGEHEHWLIEIADKVEPELYHLAMLNSYLEMPGDKTRDMRDAFLSFLGELLIHVKHERMNRGSRALAILAPASGVVMRALRYTLGGEELTDAVMQTREAEYPQLNLEATAPGQFDTWQGQLSPTESGGKTLTINDLTVVQSYTPEPHQIPLSFSSSSLPSGSLCANFAIQSS